MTCLGLAWINLAWLGLAWLGLAWLGLAWLIDSLGKILDKYRSGNKNAISLLFFCGKSIKGKQIYSVFCLPENRTAISFTYF